MTFEEGEMYSREEIHEVLGGDLQSYLPQKDGKIVCGCFRRDRRGPYDGWNPEAPKEVLVGDAPVVKAKAKLLSQQGDPICVFIKKAPRRWEYVGFYRCRPGSYSEDPGLRKRKEAESGRKGLASVFSLEKVQ